MAKFSVAWKAHNQNICNGLTSLQQNGEFVDMTLAADGHHVKVHQLVISLASPYLKEIITSIQNPHPVIFLTNISFPIMSALLEYVYTGEVVIEQNNLQELMKAARVLQIKGLDDMKYEFTMKSQFAKSGISELSGQLLADNSSSNHQEPVAPNLRNKKADRVEQEKREISEDDDFIDTNEEAIYLDEDVDSDDVEDNNTKVYDKPEIRTASIKNIGKSTDSKDEKGLSLQVQYTLSNMGSVQMILNRYIYGIRYTSNKGAQGHRLWRCVEFFKGKCRAGVVTREGVVVKRFACHNHPFHDKRILKKVHQGLVFSAIQEADQLSKDKKTTPSQ